MAWMIHDYPSPRERQNDDPICPVCKQICDSVQRGEDGEIKGCNNCLSGWLDAWTVKECFT